MARFPLLLLVACIGLAALSGCQPDRDRVLYQVEAGSGPAIIFIHGLQEDYRVFAPQLAALQGDFRVIMWVSHPETLADAVSDFLGQRRP